MTPDQERYIGMGAAAFVVVAAFMPWVKVDTAFGSISRSGIDNGGDGLFTAGLGLVAALAIWQGGRAWGWGGATAGLLVIGIGLFDIIDVSDRASSLDDNRFATAGVGAGLYATVGAGLLTTVIAITQATRRTAAVVPPLPPGSPLPPPAPPS